MHHPPISGKCTSKPNFPPEAAYPFTGAPIGEFVSYQANRENSEIIGGGGELQPPKLHLWDTRDSMAHPPKKNFPSPAAGLFWPLFLPLFYLCFYHYLYLQKKISSPAAGLFLRLVYLCFYLCFWFYVYLVFYPCLTLVFSFILLLCLPWFCVSWFSGCSCFLVFWEAKKTKQNEE